MLKKRLLELENRLLHLGLTRQSLICRAASRYFASEDESPEIYFESECTHDTDEDQCHVCGKMMS